MFNRFGFLLVPGFSCLFLCEGAIFPPTNGTKLTFIPGSSTWKIIWSFDDAIESFSNRLWVFTPRDGRRRVGLAKIDGDKNVQILTTSYEVAVEKPATLVLKNVNETYNGTYEFSLSPGGSASEVVVYIAVKPKAMACSSPVIVKEGEDVSCTCQGQGGNPPADVTWYKDNNKIGQTGKEEKTLTLTNALNKKDEGYYKCVAQCYPNEMFQDQLTVEVIVHYKPIKTKIEVPEEANVGEKLVINCDSDGLPAPNFTITHNGTTNIVSNHYRYIKDRVGHKDAGLYTCIAKNLLGSSTDSGHLIVKEKRPSTKSVPKKPTTESTPDKTTVRTTDGVVARGVSPGAIVGICVAVLLLLLVIVFIVVYCCYKKKENNGRNRGNINGGNHGEPQNEEPTEVDNAYEALVPVASGSKSRTPEKDAPPVYAAVDKDNRQGNTLYATLDTDAMKPKRESKKEDGDRAPQTEYASIDFAKTAKAAKADPV